MICFRQCVGGDCAGGGHGPAAVRDDGHGPGQAQARALVPQHVRHALLHVSMHYTLYTYTWVSVLIMIINIISDSGLVTFLRLLFLADTFLQHFLQIFSQIFLQHFLWWHFHYEFLVAMTILFVYSFKSDADGEKDLKRIRNTVLRCWL